MSIELILINIVPLSFINSFKFDLNKWTSKIFQPNSKDKNISLATLTISKLSKNKKLMKNIRNMIWVMRSDSIMMCSKMNSKMKLKLMPLMNFILLITVIPGRVAI